MAKQNLLNLSRSSSVYGIALLAIALIGFPSPSGIFIPSIYIDIEIEAPATTSIGQTFLIYGTSYRSAAERVDLYLLDSTEPIGYAVVSIYRPFEFEFEISVSSNSLSLNGVTFYEGTIEGKIFDFYIQSHSTPFNKSPIVSITIVT